MSNELLEQQGGLICSHHGHRWKVALPIQKNDETQEIFCGCAICAARAWFQLPPEGYARLLEDIKNNKIV